jgi:pyruvate kinase
MPCALAPHTEDMVRTAESELLRLHAVAPGDVMGIVAGTQQASGSTNFMRLHVVGSQDGDTHPGTKARRRPPPSGARKR